MKKFNVAIDGPSGSGKSTLAKNIAKSLGIIYLDTGAMFRCLGLKAIREKLDISNLENVIEFLKRTDVDVQYNGGEMMIYLDGEEVSHLIRENSVSKMASDISAIKEVRQHLIGLQRKIASENDVVLDGRDIGTIVLPNAKYKYYIVASSKVRAERRRLELLEKGQDIAVDVLQSQLEERDRNDCSRAVAPLRQAEDALLIDTSTICQEEVLQIVLNDIKERG